MTTPNLRVANFRIDIVHYQRRNIGNIEICQNRENDYY